MLWPVLLDAEPMTQAWTVGDEVAATLLWVTAPRLDDDLAVHGVSVTSHPASANGERYGTLLTHAGMTALLPEVNTTISRVDGCAVHEQHSMLNRPGVSGDSSA